MTPDAFLAHWEKERAPLLLGLKGLRGLIFNRVIRERSPDAPHDGIIEMWFADEAAYTHAFGAADEQLIGALADDLPRFAAGDPMGLRSEEHTSELQSLMRISYAVFCLKKKQETDRHEFDR